MCFRGSSPSFYLVPVIVFARNFLILVYVLYFIFVNHLLIFYFPMCPHRIPNDIA